MSSLPTSCWTRSPGLRTYLLIFPVSLVLPFESSGIATSISRQVFSVLSCSTTPGRFTSIVRSVITGTYHIIVVSLSFFTLSGTCSQYWSVTCNTMFTYRPVGITSHLITSTIVFRWRKCCASRNNMFYVFFCPIYYYYYYYYYYRSQ